MYAQNKTYLKSMIIVIVIIGGLYLNFYSKGHSEVKTDYCSVTLIIVKTAAQISSNLLLRHEEV